MGNPLTTDLVTATGEAHGLSTAPRYAVYPVDWAKVDTVYFINEPQINDLGEAFRIECPPDYVGIPPPYRSPELFLEKNYTSSTAFGSDLWALGCTIFEIRTGRQLFNCFDDDDDEYLIAMTRILGKMPEPWWSTTWEARKRIYKDEADSLGRVVSVRAHLMENQPPRTSTVHPSVAQGARSLREKLAAGVWYIDMSRDTHRDMPEREQELFADLLGLLLRWRPEERVSAEEVLKHEWFNM